MSAFSPIVNPLDCPWGQKAFSNYLGSVEAGKDYDATELIREGAKQEHIFIDQGLADNFLEEQLKTENFEQACKENGQAYTVKYREGYDHSYYYIASFIGEHIAWHASKLK